MIGTADQTGIDRLTDLHQGMAAMPANIGESVHRPVGVAGQKHGFGSVVEGPQLARSQQVLGPTQADPASGEDVLGSPSRKAPGIDRPGQGACGYGQTAAGGLGQQPGQWARASSSHTSRDRIGKV